MDASRYSVEATLRDGARVEIRAACPADRAGLLPDNEAMLRVFERSGLATAVSREADAVHLDIQLNPSV